jgi:signal transduction histidine kinase
MRFPTQTVARLTELLRPPPPEPAQQLFRLKSIERDIVLPIKGLYIAILIYNLYVNPWHGEALLPVQIAEIITEQFFTVYIVINVLVALFFVWRRPLSLIWGQRMVFVISVIDALFLAALTLLTEGFDSVLYWLFPGLIIRNALIFPVARVQIILNLTTVMSFLVAGVLEFISYKYAYLQMDDEMRKALNLVERTHMEPFVLRMTVLLFLTGACYGLQTLFEKARQAAVEAREFSARQEQLRSAGRMGAEIAHKIKNPLGIINNAAFAVQRAISAGKPVPLQQLDIIREEVDRADRIITELMGYAQLAEGRVEKLNVTQEINRALHRVFPPGAYRSIQVSTDYSENLPPLLMQSKHFSEILVNLLQNAREMLSNGGHIKVTAEAEDETVRIVVEDDGPGVPPEKSQKIFEPYFSTKAHGTGLGLAIVRHNTEIYDGRVRVESELGQGARFILELPTRTFMKIRQ